MALNRIGLVSLSSIKGGVTGGHWHIGASDEKRLDSSSRVRAVIRTLPNSRNQLVAVPTTMRLVLSGTHCARLGTCSERLQPAIAPFQQLR